jgi:hypothetical protein
MNAMSAVTTCVANKVLINDERERGKSRDMRPLDVE